MWQGETCSIIVRQTELIEDPKLGPIIFAFDSFLLDTRPREMLIRVRGHHFQSERCQSFRSGATHSVDIMQCGGSYVKA